MMAKRTALFTDNGGCVQRGKHFGNQPRNQCLFLPWHGASGQRVEIVGLPYREQNLYNPEDDEYDPDETIMVYLDPDSNDQWEVAREELSDIKVEEND